ncbi:hypothetical protein FH972_025591 [Carpinus fangiana]|uniref:Uncharacterized protein n=1 Tax=Carpinus fangiana TaxID=176857 RepID=A0A5N6L1F7_9ROSI|nr:hypothetical protein FH972_025591 [Carpinus fangiana]
MAGRSRTESLLILACGGCCNVHHQVTFATLENILNTSEITEKPAQYLWYVSQQSIPGANRHHHRQALPTGLQATLESKRFSKNEHEKSRFTAQPSTQPHSTMSKQYLTAHTLDDLHPADIFSLATTQTSILSASGSSSIRCNSTRTSTFPLTQTLENAHPLGCHHITTALCGTHAVSIGFGGDIKIWANETLLAADPAAGAPDADAVWAEEQGAPLQDIEQAGEVWAIALSADARYLAATAHDGRVSVWDLANPAARAKIATWATKGSFGQSVDISAAAQPGAELVSSGHASGAVRASVLYGAWSGSRVEGRECKAEWRVSLLVVLAAALGFTERRLVAEGNDDRKRRFNRRSRNIVDYASVSMLAP